MDDPALHEALTSSQALGMLGDRPVAEVVDHALAFVAALDGVDGLVLDLGTGGGVPGLVIARARPDLRLTLVDRRAARTDHLRRLVRRLGLAERVDVVTADTNALGLRGDAAVARGFGPPAVTLAAAVPLVRAGGRIVVSEPPQPDPDRWSAALLADYGVRRLPHADGRVAVFHVEHPPTSGGR
jgi:16S rRNA (guanine527-N7)-methyltransferase